MGVPTPAVGDRPFKIEKTIPSEKEEPKSYLNEQRLKDNLGRNKARRVSSAGRIAGLQTLGNSFGK